MLSKSARKLSWFEIAKMPIAVVKINKSIVLGYLSDRPNFRHTFVFCDEIT